MALALFEASTRKDKIVPSFPTSGVPSFSTSSGRTCRKKALPFPQVKP